MKLLLIKNAQGNHQKERIKKKKIYRIEIIFCMLLKKYKYIFYIKKDLILINNLFKIIKNNFKIYKIILYNNKANLIILPTGK